MAFDKGSQSEIGARYHVSRSRSRGLPPDRLGRRRRCRERAGKRRMRSWRAPANPARAESVRTGGDLGPMRRYSVFALAREALRRHTGWERAWARPAPKPRYEIVIVGAGGHGLATAYYLAKNHGIRDVAVLEKGWLGGGNTGRNTTIIRSNYLQPASAAIYEKAREPLRDAEPGAELQRDVQPARRADAGADRARAPRLEAHRARQPPRRHRERAGRPRRGSARLVPILNLDGPRYPVLGGLWQPRGGTARHDAVAWGYARAASATGRRHHPELRGDRHRPRRRRRHRRAHHAAARSRCRKLCLVVAGSSGRAGRARRLPAADRVAWRCRRWSPSRSSRCSTAW